MNDISDLLRPLIDHAPAPPDVDELSRQIKRRRQRRRRGFGMLAAVVAVVAVTASIEISRPHETVVHVEAPATSTPGAHQSSVTLPTSDLFDAITVEDGTLLLTGTSASTADSSPSACVSAQVDPQTMRTTRSRSGNCDDPALIGETVGVVMGPDLPGSMNATVRIATLNRSTGRISQGPVVFTYLDGSDTRPVTAYGGGSLWIYDVDTKNGPEAVQVSAKTGQVENTVSTPKLYRPVLAANDQGLWLGDSIDGTGGAGIDTLYRVRPGASAPTTMISGSGVVTWLLADADHLWAGVSPVPATSQTIWGFDGSDLTPLFEVPDRGFIPTNVVGDHSDGLWTMRWEPSGPRPASGIAVLGPDDAPQIVNINPDTGAETVVATLPPVPVPLGVGAYGLLANQAAVLGGSMYILEPPFRQGGYQGYSTLVRVALPPAATIPSTPTSPIPTTTTATTVVIPNSTRPTAVSTTTTPPTTPAPPSTIPTRTADPAAANPDLANNATGTCPSAATLPGGPNAVSAAITAAKAAVYTDINTTGYTVTNASPAATSGHGQIAYNQCGTTTATNTWVVELNFPAEQPSASLSQGVPFVSRFSYGWQVWYRYQ